MLQAFAALLVEHGERAATLDAVADRAGVSKGGLLYHFGSKDALVDGLAEHLRALTAADVDAMRAAPAGPVDYLIRTSTQVDTEFELVYLAVSRLAQGAYPHARAALDGAHDAWTATVLEVVADPVLARAIVLMSDGLYAHAALSGERPGDDLTSRRMGVDDLLALIDEMIALRAPRATEG